MNSLRVCIVFLLAVAGGCANPRDRDQQSELVPDWQRSNVRGAPSTARFPDRPGGERIGLVRPESTGGISPAGRRSRNLGPGLSISRTGRSRSTCRTCLRKRQRRSSSATF